MEFFAGCHLAALSCFIALARGADFGVPKVLLVVAIAFIVFLMICIIAALMILVQVRKGTRRRENADTHAEAAQE